MASDILMLLARVTLAASCAIVLILLARQRVRAWCGARAAYHLWLLVPVLMLGAALPSLRVRREIVLDALPAVNALPLGAPVMETLQFSWSSLLLLAWLAGLVAAAGRCALLQRDYVAGLGPLTLRNGVHVAATAAQGPALLGLWRPRVVLPADFAQRYSADEQALIIAHERCHAQRGDPFVNALLAALQCGCWFNPLVHVAAARCRFDQELACDADVMTRYPGTARAYASAMLKTQVGNALAPATCHWQSSHPLKERIMQLSQSTPSRARRRAARLTLASLIGAGLLATLAARAEPSSGPVYLVKFHFTAGGQTIEPALQVRAGEPFAVAFAKNGVDWKGDFLVTNDKQDGLVWLRSQFSFDGKQNKGWHNGGQSLGASQDVRIISDDGSTVLLAMRSTVSLVSRPAAPK